MMQPKTVAWRECDHPRDRRSAKSSGTQISAEGVETDEQRDLLAHADSTPSKAIGGSARSAPLPSRRSCPETHRSKCVALQTSDHRPLVNLS